jgi:hypothetical protein
MTSAYIRAGLLYLLLGSSFAIAQGDAEQAEPEARSLMQIEVKPDERIPEGKSAFIKGGADKIGDKYLVEGIELTQPIHVGVFTKNAGEKVRVRIVKDDWEHAEREENTNDTGKAEFKFRTFDNFKIWVTADQETPYQLMVWIGDEINTNQPPVAVPASEYVEPKDGADTSHNNKAEKTSSNGVSFSYLELGLIGAVILLVLGFVVILLRKKN